MSSIPQAESPHRLTDEAKLFVLAVASTGLLLVVSAANSLFASNHSGQWAWLAVLTLVSGYFTVKLPSIPSTISVSETFVIASVLLLGKAAGTLTVLLDALVITLRFRKRHDPWKVAFNLSAGPIALWAGASVFELLDGHPPSASRQDLPELLLPLLALTSTYFLLNSWLVAIALGLEHKRSPTTIWSNHLRSVAINYFGGASMAALFVAYTPQVTFAVVGLLLPLLLIAYLTSKTSLARVEDADRHVAEVRDLYFDTIQSLAIAVDAKDQVTHGHIRRVQHLALELAKRLGVRDRRSLEAIEAGALLHDIGKIAIPEFILNKPGKLEAAELAVMQTHAAKGAEMLASLKFPYPVVPIVRSHHENWDGSGYPDGLSRTDVPLGARILSVVDCFDALTSSRPYRPAMAQQDAMQILLARRGSMYDPLVVDAFVQMLADSPTLFDGGLSGQELGLDKSSRPTAILPAYATASRRQFGTASNSEITQLCETLSQTLATFIPHDGLALYQVEATSSDLVLIAATGSIPLGAVGVRVAQGEQVSGWVAANGVTAINSPFALEYPTHAASERGLLMTTVSSGPVLRGIVGLSASGPTPFLPEHANLLEMVASSGRMVSSLDSYSG